MKFESSYLGALLSASQDERHKHKDEQEDKEDEHKNNYWKNYKSFGKKERFKF